MVEQHTTFTVPTELVERADQAYEAYMDTLGESPKLGHAEYWYRLGQARRDLSDAYREIRRHLAFSGGLFRGLELAGQKLDRQIRDGKSRSAATGASEGGDRG